MYLLFEKSRNGISAKEIIQPIVSLGMPSTIYSSKNNIWALKMNNEEEAKDAAKIANKYIEQLYHFYGPNIKITYVSNLPDIRFAEKKISGRAEK